MPYYIFLHESIIKSEQMEHVIQNDYFLQTVMNI